MVHLLASLLTFVHFPDNRGDGWEPLRVERPGDREEVIAATKVSIKVWTPADLVAEDELEHPPPTITYKGMAALEQRLDQRCYRLATNGWAYEKGSEEALIGRGTITLPRSNWNYFEQHLVTNNAEARVILLTFEDCEEIAKVQITLPIDEVAPAELSECFCHLMETCSRTPGAPDADADAAAAGAGAVAPNQAPRR